MLAVNTTADTNDSTTTVTATTAITGNGRLRSSDKDPEAISPQTPTQPIKPLPILKEGNSSDSADSLSPATSLSNSTPKSVNATPSVPHSSHSSHPTISGQPEPIPVITLLRDTKVTKKLSNLQWLDSWQGIFPFTSCCWFGNMRYASVLIAGGFLTWALITLVMASIQFSKYILWIDGVEIGLHVIWVAADLFGIHATFRKEPRRTWLYAHWITLRIIVAFALRCVGFQHSRLPFTLAAAIIVLLIQVYFVLCLWSFALTILPSDDMYAYPKRANSQKRACSQNGTPRPAPSVILRPDVSTDTQSIRSGSIMNPSNFTSAIQSPDSPTLSHSSIPISYPITHSIPSPPIMDGPVSGVLDSAHTTMSPNEIEDMTSSQVFFASLPRKRALADQDNMSSSSLPTSFLTSEGSDQPAVYTIKTHTRSSSNPPYPLDHKASFATLQHNKVPASYPPPQDIGPAVPKVFLE